MFPHTHPIFFDLLQPKLKCGVPRTNPNTFKLSDVVADLEDAVAMLREGYAVAGALLVSNLMREIKTTDNGDVGPDRYVSIQRAFLDQREATHNAVQRVLNAIGRAGFDVRATIAGTGDMDAQLEGLVERLIQEVLDTRRENSVLQRKIRTLERRKKKPKV